MEELIASQVELLGRIARTWENLKKAGQQNINIDLVRATLILLDNKWSRFEEQHALLMRNHRAALKDNEYVTGDLMATAEVQYMSQRAHLLRLERQYTTNAADETSKAPATAQALPAPPSSYPRIELPKFSGKFEDWPAFRDLFASMVIEEVALPNVRKLHYLKTSVQGEAESLLKNLPTTDDNFQRAWTTIKEHFENKRLLVRAHLNAFTALPKMRANSMSDLRQIFHGVMTTAGALEGLGRPITSSEDLWVHSVVNLLDQTLRREWDKIQRKNSEPPTFKELQTFLKEQLTSEEALAASQPEPTAKQPSRSGRTIRSAQQRAKQPNPGRPCPVCNGDHFFGTCEQLLRRPPLGRKELVATHNRCFNCLGRHAVSSCPSSKNCLKCNGRHHSSLHEAFAPSPSPATGGVAIHHAKLLDDEDDAAVLATARVWITDSVGREHLIRALVDPGAEASLVTESLVQRLRLPRVKASLALYDYAGDQSGAARGRATMTLTAHDKGFQYTMSPLIVPRLSVSCGSFASDPTTWRHVEGLRLADPNFTARDPVELFLGARAYGDVIMGKVRRGKRRDPVAQLTRLGWILIGGRRMEGYGAAINTIHRSGQEDIATALRRFWEWEEPLPVELPPTEEDRQAEEFFLNSFERLSSGRFQVRLPLRTQPSSELPTTRRNAQRMLSTLEGRFARDPEFQSLYDNFMDEYLALGHMTLATQATSNENSCLCYLPHHGVVKRKGDAKKLRVVFNASARTTTGTSLNDHLLTGPNLLPALPDVILRWRRHRFAFVADIEKMYRQVEVHPENRELQRILWRHNGSVAEFRLNTLTYGMACAPFLAIRVLQQLALEEERTFPAGAAALRHEVYVDDVLSGASTLEAGIEKRRELSALCMAGGFPLRKWAASHPELLQGVPMPHCQTPATGAELPHTECSVLGLRWLPEEDQLTISVAITPTDTSTKRSVLSEVARLFDPLGWLAPVVIQAKALLQTTWLQQLHWDAPLRAQEASVWHRLVEELPAIEQLRIPRWFPGFLDGGGVQIHGFADASERAYGAVVYVRTEGSGTASVSLVQAKSKVAPLRQISLPRLELCAAALLAKLSAHVRQALGITAAPTFHWSDSTVVLAWLRAHPSRWTTFVANRVAEIHRESHSVQWRHVPGKDNPADCVSRGLSPKELLSHDLWWRGPAFLLGDAASWPGTEDPRHDGEIPEAKRTSRLVATQVTVEPPELTRFSKLTRLLRITAWLRRWRVSHRRSENKEYPQDGLILHPQELETALRLWVRVSQHIAFGREIQAIREGRAVPRQSPLLKLTPFLDQEGILRVGGRIKHALLDADQRHPFILAPASHLSRLIVDAHHAKTLHGGTQATLASTRHRFWILRGRQVVKGWIHRCPRCIRWRAASPQPMMGDLPSTRVTPSRPFLHSGVDFAGPIKLRTTRGRGHRSYKAFLCVFVCFSTRAVHLEVVSDYTTEAFLAAFRRFVSRRGLCAALYSDRGTNFIGADAELRALFSGATADSQHIAGRLSDQGVRWVFNPPAAPHFGGLWEAAVKSMKHHVRRVIGETTLTFEEMATLLAEIEACLNSRPLQAMSDDPEDLNPLTPGHFLVGGPLNAIPEPSLLDTPANRTSRWQSLQKMRDHMWDRWSREYIQSLTPRPKWWRIAGGLTTGQLCIIKEERTAPTKWPLGRVTRLHQGSDGQVRVAELKTQSGSLTRPVVKLVPLPGTDPSTLIGSS